LIAGTVQERILNLKRGMLQSHIDGRRIAGRDGSVLGAESMGRVVSLPISLALWLLKGCFDQAMVMPAER
jgi:hypothetical protein